MKIRIYTIILAVGIMTIAAGCSGNMTKEDTATVNSSAESETAEEGERPFHITFAEDLMPDESGTTENNDDLLAPTALHPIGWFDSAPEGLNINFSGGGGGFAANYNLGSLNNKEVNERRDFGTVDHIDPLNAMLIRESFTEERAKEKELKFTTKLEEIPDILRQQKFFEQGLKDFAGLSASSDQKLNITVDKSENVTIN